MDRTLPLFPSRVLLQDVLATQSVRVPRGIKIMVPIPMRLSTVELPGIACVLLAKHQAGAAPVGRFVLSNIGEVVHSSIDEAPSEGDARARRTVCYAPGAEEIVRAQREARAVAHERYLALVDKLRAANCSWDALDEVEWSDLRSAFVALTDPLDWQFYAEANPAFYARLGPESRLPTPPCCPPA